MEIQFDTKRVETGSGVNFYGTIDINGNIKQVVCSATHEFLQDISRGSTSYIEIFESNFWTIEQIADDKLNSLLPVDLEKNPIKIQILSSDKERYDF